MNKRIIVLIIVVLGLLIAGAYWFFKPHPKAKLILKPVPVKVYQVKKHNLPITAFALGEVLAPHSIMLKARRSGIITSILVKDGQHVAAGQLLITLNHQAELAQLKQQQADLWQAKLNYQRQLKLSKRDPGAVSQMDLDNLLSKVQYYQAAVAYADKQYHDTFIRAPFAGVVGAPETILGQTDSSGNSLTSITQVTKGAYVSISQPLLTMVGLKQLQVSYELPQSYMASARLGQQIMVTSNAYPDRHFEAVVSYISPNVDMINRTINVRGKLISGLTLLKPGSLVEVKQILDAHHQIMVVPAIALMPSLSGYQAYVVRKGKAEMVNVQAGHRDNQWIAIRSGLKLGDQVIVAGQNSVRPGQKVKVVKGQVKS